MSITAQCDQRSLTNSCERWFKPFFSNKHGYSAFNISPAEHGFLGKMFFCCEIFYSSRITFDQAEPCIEVCLDTSNHSFTRFYVVKQRKRSSANELVQTAVKLIYRIKEFFINGYSMRLTIQTLEASLCHTSQPALPFSAFWMHNK